MSVISVVQDDVAVVFGRVVMRVRRVEEMAQHTSLVYPSAEDHGVRCQIPRCCENLKYFIYRYCMMQVYLQV